MVSNASEDFPDPLKPVITVKVLRGISTSIFFKLCCRAPCTVMRLIIARGKPYFSSAWLLLVLAGGGWFARGAGRGAAAETRFPFMVLFCWSCGAFLFLRPL